VLRTNHGRILTILLLVSLLFACLACICKMMVKIENLEEELYREQIKSFNLELQNEKLAKQIAEHHTGDTVNFDDGWKLITVTATAYAPLDNRSGICADENPNVTAVGVKPVVGVIAVNPDLIPYYSKIIIIGDGWIIEGQALDTGGKMRQEVYWIDVYMDSYDEAINFGRQQVIVLFKEA